MNYASAMSTFPQNSIPSTSVLRSVFEDLVDNNQDEDEIVNTSIEQNDRHSDQDDDQSLVNALSNHDSNVIAENNATTSNSSTTIAVPSPVRVANEASINLADQLNRENHETISENNASSDIQSRSSLTANPTSNIISAVENPIVIDSDSNNEDDIRIVNVNANANANANATNQDESVIEESDDEEYQFKSKMPRLHSNLDLKNATKSNDNDNKENGGDEEVCSICFEPWTNSGIHRLVCLKCGHLFGEGCIDRWVKSNPKCPQCNRPSKRTDIRRIYAKSIKVLDTAELDKALKDLENERLERKKAEISASEMKLQYQLVFDELSFTKRKYKELLERSQQTSGGDNLCASVLSNSSFINNGNKTSLSFNMEKSINLTEAGGCRVVSFSHRNMAILASQPSNNPIFPGSGIKKFNILDMKISQYIPIHSKPIRDMALSTHQNDEIVLTGGLDKFIKLTSLSSNRLIHTYELPQPVWSVAFNSDNPTYFYAGLANGLVYMFDKRKIDGHVKALNDVMSSPVCSLQYVPKDTQSSKIHHGLLVAQLDKVTFHQEEGEDHRYIPLLMESNIMSCAYHSSRHVLVSTRPSQKYPNVRHLVYELSNNPNGTENSSLNLIQSYSGSVVQKILAKSKMFTLEQKLYGLSPCESNKAALIWDVSTGETKCKLPNQADIIDVCPISIQESVFICTLTEKQLKIFKKS